MIPLEDRVGKVGGSVAGSTDREGCWGGGGGGGLRHRFSVDLEGIMKRF